MPLGAVNLSFSPSTASPAAVVPISGTSAWVTAIEPGGMTVSELSGSQTYLNDPALITDSSRNILSRPTSGGTTLCLSLYYQTSDTIDTTKPPLTIRVFGRDGSTGKWVALRNLANDASVPIITNPLQDTIVATDSEEGLFWSQTVPDNSAHCWDCDGYSQFVVGIEKKYSTTGSLSNPSVAYLLAKIV